MRKRFYKNYLLFGVTLFFIISIPALCVEQIRNTCVSILSPFWRCKSLCVHAPDKMKENLQRLEGENHLLHVELNHLTALIEHRCACAALQEECQEGGGSHPETCKLLNLERHALPARVIYRDPSNWSSTLWINVGAATNRTLKRKAVAVDSPIVIGRCLIGVIDFVGNHQSRVRLITDVGLKPSVRAARGRMNSIALVSHIDSLLYYLTRMPEQTALTEELKALKGQLTHSEEKQLAKGIVQGSGKSLWRNPNQLLKGIGFNDDCVDAKNEGGFMPSHPLLQVGDILVTSGMDGIFPPGLLVGSVTKIFPLREGGITYELEARPAFKDLDDLHILFVLPVLTEKEEFALLPL